MKSCRALLVSILASVSWLSGGASAQVATEFSVGITANSRPLNITAGPDGNLWFTDTNSFKIGRITPLGVVTEFNTSITGGNPSGIVSGPDGNLWFAERYDDRVGRITPLGVITEFSAGLTSGAEVIGIAAGPDGNLWFTERSLPGIARITPTGVITEFKSGLSAGSDPFYITAGPDGNLWFTEYSGNRIGRITPLGVITEFSTGITADANPLSIVAGPDGNLWFTEWQGDRIGRITPLGVITEFSAGITQEVFPINSGSFPFGITTGPDGNLWFTELVGNRIGRINTGVLPPVLLSAVSRKVHGAAGTFDLPLSTIATDPTTEPRQSLTATIVMSFDTAIVSADATVTEGTAAVGTLGFSGNDVIVPISSVSGQQYVTISLSNVLSAANTGSGSIRVGFLLGDVNQNRVVSLADLGLVNAQLAQQVTAANFLNDVNASGTLSLADKGITNANLTKALPAP